MNIVPFQRIENIPNGRGGVSDILKGEDLIDLMDKFDFQLLSQIRKSYYRGIKAFMFDSQIYMGFDRNYKIVDFEIRRPFSFLNGEGVCLAGVEMIFSTLFEVDEFFSEKGITVKKINVGLEIPEVGVSFFSSEYEGDLGVSLDAITFSFGK